MEDNIKVLLTEKEVDTRIQELGEQISKDYAGEDVSFDLCAEGRRIFHV